MRILRSFLSGLVLLLLPALPVLAQQVLNPTTWTENVGTAASDSSSGALGSDGGSPENLSAGAIKDGAGASAYVDFQSSFPPPCTPRSGPRGKAGASASVAPGSPVDALGTFTVEFQLRIVQTSPPPVAVTSAPISASVCGTVEATGTYPPVAATAFSSVAIWYLPEGQPTNYLVNVVVNAGNSPASGFPAMDSFDFTRTDDFPVGVVLDGRIVVNASCYSTQSPTSSGSAGATAFADPVIEIADQVIPGSSASYRDHFSVEFGPGYDALGDPPTPVRSTTWGRLKSLYGG